MRTSAEIQKDLDEAEEEMWLLTRHRRNQDYVHKDSEYISEYNKQIKHIHNLQINLNQAKQREWMEKNRNNSRNRDNSCYHLCGSEEQTKKDTTKMR